MMNDSLKPHASFSKSPSQQVHKSPSSFRRLVASFSKSPSQQVHKSPSSFRRLVDSWTRGLVDSFDQRKSVGFSLIEVLVATALLVMVVGMIGFVFRQSSMSWDSGIHRAEGISQVRAVMGAIERDLRLAVDAREFPGPGIRQQFTSTTLQFVILDDPETGDSDARVPKLVTISGGSKVTRTPKRLVYQSGNWTTNTSDNDEDEKGTATLLDSGDCSVSFETPPDYRESDGGLPAYVRINATLEVTEKFSGLEVRSLGPNGNKNNVNESTGEEKGDDIVVK